MHMTANKSVILSLGLTKSSYLIMIADFDFLCIHYNPSFYLCVYRMPY